MKQIIENNDLSTNTVNAVNAPEKFTPPPLGVIPRILSVEMGVTDAKRLKDLRAAVARRSGTNFPILKVWTDEIAELTSIKDVDGNVLKLYSEICTIHSVDCAPVAVCTELDDDSADFEWLDGSGRFHMWDDEFRYSDFKIVGGI